MNDYVNPKTPGVVFYGIVAVSMSMIAFEISLVRLLSVVLSYHYVYWITSLALLGSGIGAFVVHYREKKSGADYMSMLYRRLNFRLIMAAVTMIFVTIAIIQAAKGGGSIVFYGVLLCMPFFFQGMFLSSLFRVFSEIGSKLYFADLLGAASGCILVVIALNTFNDVECILLFSGVIAISALLMSLRCHTGNRMVAASGAALVLPIIIMVVNLAFPALLHVPIGDNAEKEIYDSLKHFEGEIIETRWSAFGRTDLVQYDKIPEHLDIYLDGTAGTPMYAFNGNVENPNPKVAELRTFPGYFPFQFFDPEQKDTSLIIGPGGGRDVLIALLGGTKKITAIEVNLDLVEIVKDYSSMNGGLYTSFEQVELIVDEGRSYLRSHDTGKFDSILLTLPRTNTSRSKEGYALTENYLITTDSIKEYLDRLTEGGHLVVVANDDVEILRLLSLVIEVCAERGQDVETAMKSLYILGADPNPVFVLKNHSFNTEEIEEIYNAALKWPGYNPQTSFFPGIGSAERPISPILYGLANGQITPDELIAMVRDYGYNITPVSDDDPFFYKLEAGLPISIRASLVLSVLLLIIVSAGIFVIDRNRITDLSKQANHFSGRFRYLIVFAMLGMGYMIVEVSLIQKFVFFLGKPVLSLAVILFVVLLGTGIGSYATSRIPKEHEGKAILISTITIALALISYNYIILPLLFHYFLGNTLLWRTLLSVIILLPLSMIMGMPFPLTIRRLGRTEHQSLIPWMWGINSVSSVVGAVTAMAIAILAGFNSTVMVGASCYLVATLASRRWKARLNNK